MLAPYLPRDLLLRHGETCDGAAWVVKPAGLHVVLLLRPCGGGGLARSLVCRESCREDPIRAFVRHGYGVNTQTSTQKPLTQSWCIFCWNVLRFECVHNPLQGSGRLDGLQRAHTRESGAGTRFHLFIAAGGSDPDRPGGTTCSSSRASLRITASERFSSFSS